MAVALTREILQQLAPRPSNAAKAKIWDGYVDALISPEGNALFQKYAVTNSQRMAHFLSQALHETGSLTILWESGNYSARRITQIFGVGHHSARVTESEARSLAGNAYALFERVYGLGNPSKARELGNREKGDGFRYRGLGILQTTGRGSHEEFAGKVGCPVDKLCEPLNSIHAALLEWEAKKCNVSADSDDVVGVTKKINGGRNGLAERRAYLAKAKRVLARAPNAPIVVPSRPNAAPSEPVVIIGDENGSVREMQELLARAGYVIPIDGKMGPRTESAVAGFQVNHGLPGTGVADSETWKALREAKPVERSVDRKKLENESVIMKAAKRIEFWMRWIYRTVWVALFGGVADQATGLDVAEKASNQVDRITSLAGKVPIPAAAHDWRAWALLGLVVVALGAWLVAKWAKEASDARLEDALTGANLSK